MERAPDKEEYARLYASREAYKRCLEFCEKEKEAALAREDAWQRRVDRLHALLSAVSAGARADTEALHDQIDSLKEQLRAFTTLTVKFKRPRVDEATDAAYGYPSRLNL